MSALFLFVVKGHSLLVSIELQRYFALFSLIVQATPNGFWGPLFVLSEVLAILHLKLDIHQRY